MSKRCRYCCGKWIIRSKVLNSKSVIKERKNPMSKRSIYSCGKCNKKIHVS